ncbi:MAG: serine/threonine-protein kinase, partial [Myxococcota bacterium]
MPAAVDQSALPSRYELFAEIGAGGMATVHLGRLTGPSGFSKVVAVKRLHRHNAVDPEFVSMFVDEARLAARIQHPNVVSTLDIVRREQELLLVMEYVHGVSLHVLGKEIRRRRRRLAPEVIAAVIGGALQGLHAAHSATDPNGVPLGLVHRDVSPQNLLVGADGICRVLDFGIAMADSRSQQTQDGRLKGKLSYMAPEQLEGGRIDRRVDVFAAGIVLWETLTGRRMFAGEHVGEIVGKVLAGRIEAPSTAGAETDAFDEVTLRALARSPDERYDSAIAMARAVEAAVTPATALQVADHVRAYLGPVLDEREAMVSGVRRGRALPTVSIPTETDAHEEPGLAPAIDDPPTTPIHDEEVHQSSLDARGTRSAQVEAAPAIAIPQNRERDDVATTVVPRGEPALAAAMVGPTASPRRQRWLLPVLLVGALVSVFGLMQVLPSRAPSAPAPSASLASSDAEAPRSAKNPAPPRASASDRAATPPTATSAPTSPPTATSGP